MEVTAEMIIAVVTAIVTYIFGFLSKKFNWIESKYIPIQNVIIGICAGILCKILGLADSNMLVTMMYTLFGSMTAGGTYDLTKAKEE